MGGFSKPKIIIDVAHYNQLLDDSKCEVESTELKEMYISFLKNFMQITGNYVDLILAYNSNPLGKYLIIRSPDGTVEITEKP